MSASARVRSALYRSSWLVCKSRSTRERESISTSRRRIVSISDGVNLAPPLLSVLACESCT